MSDINISDLCKCCQVINNNSNIQLGIIRASFEKSIIEIEHAHTSPFYGNLHGLVALFKSHITNMLIKHT